jgi:translation initiation factor 1
LLNTHRFKLSTTNIVLPSSSVPTDVLIQQLQLQKPKDTAKDAFKDTAAGKSGLHKEIHLRIVQRKTRKYLTTIEGLDLDTIDVKGMLSKLKKSFFCSGAVIHKVPDDEKSEKIIQLSGDQRDNVKKFLISEKMAQETQIKTHGF